MKLLSFSNICAERLPALFSQQGIQYYTLDCVNWQQDYPYKPQVSFAAMLSQDALLLHYKVNEISTAAVEALDNGRVWEDSCCEFFCDFGPAHSEVGYYNIEASCIGKVHFAFGPDRTHRTLAPQKALEGISRYSTLGTETFSERAELAWELALVVPFSSFFAGKVDAATFKEVRINVYKCGDKLSTPHFVSLAPINTPSPDFHRPEFFVPASSL